MQKQNTGNVSRLRRTRYLHNRVFPLLFIRSAAVTHCICCVYVFLCVSKCVPHRTIWNIDKRRNWCGDCSLSALFLRHAAVRRAASTPHNSCSTYWLCWISVGSLSLFYIHKIHPLFESCIRSYYRQFLSFPLSFCLLVFCLMSLSAWMKQNENASRS